MIMQAEVLNYNPLWALLLFMGMALLLFLIFRPGKGIYWLMRRGLKIDKKTLLEDILKEMYRMEAQGRKTDIQSLTRALKENDSTIVKAVHDMAVSALLTIEGEQIELSPSGRQYALRIIRVHRLWEKYLAEKTGFDKSEWHDRAEEMEHKLDPEQANQLAMQLGFPIYDPHGDPIPNRHGKIKDLQGKSLAALKEGKTGTIVHIEDEPEAVYKQILAEKIHIGSEISIMENNAQRLVFHSEGEEFVLAPIVAANITVLEGSTDAPTSFASRLSSLKAKEKARIVGISKECRGANRRRLLDLGFVRGATIEVDLESPLKNPVAYAIKGTSIALRDDQAAKILIVKEG